ncbi:MAG: hypothetical protein NC191_06000 [Muribaculaceae bacterium]|nr:hypothetical protein [Muribaculaceae bacterium]
MSISRVNFTSFATYQNSVNNRQEAQTAETVSAAEHSQKFSNKQIGLGFVLGSLGLLAFGIAHKFGKFFGKLVKKPEPLIQQINNKITRAVEDSDVIVPEVVDTRYLKPTSKLRMKPEIVDADFVEI